MQEEKLKKLSMPLHEAVEVRCWMDSQTFMNGIVLGKVTPGSLADEGESYLGGYSGHVPFGNPLLIFKRTPFYWKELSLIERNRLIFAYELFIEPLQILYKTRLKSCELSRT